LSWLWLVLGVQLWTYHGIVGHKATRRGRVCALEFSHSCQVHLPKEPPKASSTHLSQKFS